MRPTVLIRVGGYTPLVARVCPGMRMLASLLLGALRWFRGLVEGFPTVRLLQVVDASIALPCEPLMVSASVPAGGAQVTMRVGGYLVRAGGGVVTVTPPTAIVSDVLRLSSAGEIGIAELSLLRARALLLHDRSRRTWHLTLSAGDGAGRIAVAWPGGCTGDLPEAEAMVCAASRYRDAGPGLAEMLGALERALPAILL